MAVGWLADELSFNGVTIPNYGLNAGTKLIDCVTFVLAMTSLKRLSSCEWQTAFTRAWEAVG